MTTFGSIVALQFGGLLLNAGGKTTTVTLPNTVEILKPAASAVARSGGRRADHRDRAGDRRRLARRRPPSASPASPALPREPLSPAAGSTARQRTAAVSASILTAQRDASGRSSVLGPVLTLLVEKYPIGSVRSWPGEHARRVRIYEARPVGPVRPPEDRRPRGGQDRLGEPSRRGRVHLDHRQTVVVALEPGVQQVHLVHLLAGDRRSFGRRVVARRTPSSAPAAMVPSRVWRVTRVCPASWPRRIQNSSRALRLDRRRDDRQVAARDAAAADAAP